MPESSPPDQPCDPDAGNRHGRRKSTVARQLFRAYICQEAVDKITKEYKGKGTGDSLGQALERKLGVDPTKRRGKKAKPPGRRDTP